MNGSHMIIDEKVAEQMDQRQRTPHVEQCIWTAKEWELCHCGQWDKTNQFQSNEGQMNVGNSVTMTVHGHQDVALWWFGRIC